MTKRDRHKAKDRLGLKIVSGGQTGVDRAALDVALRLKLPCGGWCPLGRKAEDGPLDPHYPLTESTSVDYAQRTEWNVRDSDGTLVLHRGPLSGGTALTVSLAKSLKKPLQILDLDDEPEAAAVHDWLQQQGIHVLNVAGPRESQNPGIYHKAEQFLEQVLTSRASCLQSRSRRLR